MSLATAFLITIGGGIVLTALAYPLILRFTIWFVDRHCEQLD